LHVYGGSDAGLCDDGASVHVNLPKEPSEKHLAGHYDTLGNDRVIVRVVERSGKHHAGADSRGDEVHCAVGFESVTQPHVTPDSGGFKVERFFKRRFFGFMWLDGGVCKVAAAGAKIAIDNRIVEPHLP
jgi:hypothetical protein